MRWTLVLRPDPARQRSCACTDPRSSERQRWVGAAWSRVASPRRVSRTCSANGAGWSTKPVWSPANTLRSMPSAAAIDDVPGEVGLHHVLGVAAQSHMIVEEFFEPAVRERRRVGPDEGDSGSARLLQPLHEMPLTPHVAALKHAVGSRWYGAKKRFSGIHLVASDTRWATGTGDEIRGPVASLRLVATGREAGRAQVEGPGTDRTRLRMRST